MPAVPGGSVASEWQRLRSVSMDDGRMCPSCPLCSYAPFAICSALTGSAW